MPAERMGCPVVMKIISPQIVHKSDAGGVIVGIGSRKAALGAFTKIIDGAKAYNPDAQIEGVIVEQQAEPGLELIIGGKTDPAFGKVITFGMGGTMVELMKDVTLRILPITEDEIRQMIKEINAYPLIAGYRGSKPRDEEELVRIITNVARFFEENENVVEFDINPLRLYEKGACAVDARIIVDRRDASGRDQRADTGPDGIFQPAFDRSDRCIAGLLQDGVCSHAQPAPLPRPALPGQQQALRDPGTQGIPDHHRHPGPGRSRRYHGSRHPCPARH